jgi:hypothetical protein
LYGEKNFNFVKVNSNVSDQKPGVHGR